MLFMSLTWWKVLNFLLVHVHLVLTLQGVHLLSSAYPS